MAVRRSGSDCGDVAILRGPAPYTAAELPDRPAQAVILPGQRMLGRARRRPDPRCGCSASVPRATIPACPTEMLTGTYQVNREVSQRLLRALPPLLTLRAGERDCPLIPLLADEIVKDEPGQEAVLDRLLDLLLIAVLRAWLARPDTHAPGWTAGTPTRSWGAALRQILPRRRNSPGPCRDWPTWPARPGPHSRAGSPTWSARRRWPFWPVGCIALAADMLRDPQATLGAAARQVGYATPYALSTAFKRLPRRQPARVPGPDPGSLGQAEATDWRPGASSRSATPPSHGSTSGARSAAAATSQRGLARCSGGFTRYRAASP